MENILSIKEGVRSISASEFKDRIDITSVIIPSSVIYIDESAFEGCTSLVTVTIGDGVREIGDSVFSGCSKLTSITLPDSVEKIGASAFYGCGLTFITIPDSVTKISGQVFNDSSFKEIICNSSTPAEITSSGRNLNTPLKMVVLKVPKGSIEVYKQADGWKKFQRIEEV